MRKHGIVKPWSTLRAAHAADLLLAVSCAFLEQETAGGQNIFGHDPTIYVGAGKVTKRKYHAYKRRRDAHLPQGPRRQQGVGPMQLTHYSFQNRADRLGGSWKPRVNMEVGFSLVRRYLDQADGRPLVRAGAAYNGAVEYGFEVAAKRNVWRQRLP